jgi:hypothetical protein
MPYVRNWSRTDVYSAPVKSRESTKARTCSICPTFSSSESPFSVCSTHSWPSFVNPIGLEFTCGGIACARHNPASMGRPSIIPAGSQIHSRACRRFRRVRGMRLRWLSRFETMRISIPVSKLVVARPDEECTVRKTLTVAARLWIRTHCKSRDVCATRALRQLPNGNGRFQLSRQEPPRGARPARYMRREVYSSDSLERTVDAPALFSLPFQGT